MSGNAFGLNILAQTVRDRNALMAWLNAAKPAACVVMDSHELTQQIKAALPDATIIHRAYNPNDNRWWEAVTPQDWLNAHIGFAANGVVLQTLNEPVLNDAGMAWLEQVCALCPADVALAFPNFAVGNPHENDIMAGKYDRILRLVCGTRHILALHEYFKDDPIDEVPYLCGRYNYWMMRADQLMLPEPRICITEHGRDVGGGRNDGWKGTGWSEQEYFDRLADANHSVYMPDVPVCIFCWGHGFNDDWLSFDIQDAGTLKSRLVEWNATHPMKEQAPVPPPVTYPPGSDPAEMQVNQPSGVKLRVNPNTSAATVRVLPLNEAVVVYAEPVVSASGYNWQRVETWRGEAGWSANFIDGRPSFVPIVTPEPEPPTFKLYTPFREWVITSRFNDPRSYPFAPDKLQKHEGEDGVDGLAMEYGSDPMVHVGKAGVVVKVGYDQRGYGHYCIVDFGGGWRCWYAHFERIYVEEGQPVEEREILGLMGATGMASGEHCHLTLTKTPEGLDGYVVADVVNPRPHLVTW